VGHSQSVLAGHRPAGRLAAALAESSVVDARPGCDREWPLFEPDEPVITALVEAPVPGAEAVRRIEMPLSVVLAVVCDELVLCAVAIVDMIAAAVATAPIFKRPFMVRLLMPCKHRHAPAPRTSNRGASTSSSCSLGPTEVDRGWLDSTRRRGRSRV
jgi:hypothetical protein